MSKPVSKVSQKARRDMLLLHFIIDEIGIANMKSHMWENVSKRLEDRNDEIGYHDKPTPRATKQRYTALLSSLKQMEPTCDIDKPVGNGSSEPKQTIMSKTPSDSSTPQMLKSLSSNLKSTPSKPAKVKSRSAKDVKDTTHRMKEGKKTRIVTRISGEVDEVEDRKEGGEDSSWDEGEV